MEGSCRSGPAPGLLLQPLFIGLNRCQGLTQTSGGSFHPRPPPAELPQFLNRFDQLRTAAAVQVQVQLQGLGWAFTQGWLAGAKLDLLEAMREHQAFHQGVAGQTVGPMQASAGHFAHGIEPRQGGGGLEIRRDPSHPVVGSRGHRDWPFQRIKSEFIAAVQDRGEASFGLLAGNGGEVEPHLFHLLPLHGLHQGSAHLVPM